MPEHPAVRIYAAEGEVEGIHEKERLKLINRALENSQTTDKVKSQLKAFLYDWPSASTENLGSTCSIKDKIKTTDELPL